MNLFNSDNRFARNPHYLEYEELMLQLADAMARGDEETADQIRDMMDVPERWLNSAEIERLNGLSADLYMLSNEEIREKSNMTVAETMVLLKNAAAREDAKIILQLLRLDSHTVDDFNVAVFRSDAYEALGHTAPAERFMLHAIALRPDRVEPKLELLALLSQARRFEAAAAHAEQFMSKNDISANLVLTCAQLYFDWSRELRDDARAAQLETAASYAARAINVDVRPLDNSEKSFAHAILSICCYMLGRLDDALHEADAAITLNARNDAAYAVRGVLRMDQDYDSARADFEIAVHLGTKGVTPYLALARDALARERPVECRELCEHLLARPLSPRIRAMAYEFLAIATFELSGSSDQVTDLFQTALDLDPLNDRIRQNFTLVQEAFASSQTSLVRGLELLSSDEVVQSYWQGAYPAYVQLHAA